MNLVKHKKYNKDLIKKVFVVYFLFVIAW